MLLKDVRLSASYPKDFNISAYYDTGIKIASLSASDGTITDINVPAGQAGVVAKDEKNNLYVTDYEQKLYGYNSVALGYKSRVGAYGIKVLSCSLSEGGKTPTFQLSCENLTNLEHGTIDDVQVEVAVSGISGDIIGGYLNTAASYFGTLRHVDKGANILEFNTNLDLGWYYSPKSISAQYIYFIRHPGIGNDIQKKYPDVHKDMNKDGMAVGYNSVAESKGSFAEGKDTIAAGLYSHAEGRGTIAGFASHAEGYNCDASKSNCHAAGIAATAKHDYSFVWNADGWGEDRDKYCSHGKYSFNINPTSNVAGQIGPPVEENFFIGNKSLKQHILDISQGGGKAVDSRLSALEKSVSQINSKIGEIDQTLTDIIS